jgi:TatD DNase family protein
MYIDTHAHFGREKEGYSLDELIARAREAEIERIVAVGGSAELDTAALKASDAFPEMIRPTLGYDRDEAERLCGEDGDLDAAIVALRESIAARAGSAAPVVAMGEMGLDFHYSPESAPQQEALFNAQLALARELQMPVVIHTREADEATLQVLQAHVEQWEGDPTRVGVVHCFTGSQPFADALLAMGLIISFSGIVSFSNADSLRAVARTIPDDRIVIETDSPFLAPVPRRGSRNEPAYVVHVAECLAVERGQSLETLAALTTANARRLFAW